MEHPIRVVRRWPRRPTRWMIYYMWRSAHWINRKLDVVKNTWKTNTNQVFWHVEIVGIQTNRQPTEYRINEALIGPLIMWTAWYLKIMTFRYNSLYMTFGRNTGTWPKMNTKDTEKYLQISKVLPLHQRTSHFGNGPPTSLKVFPLPQRSSQFLKSPQVLC